MTTVPVAVVDAAERLEAGGIVAAQESALVSSRIVATILTVHVRAGDRIGAGDVLVTLDARDVADHNGRHAPPRSRRRRRSYRHGRSSAPRKRNTAWPPPGRRASRRCTAATPPPTRNATRPRPVWPRRRRASRALRLASRWPMPISRRRVRPSARRRRPSRSRPCGHRSTASSPASHRSRQSGRAGDPAPADRIGWCRQVVVRSGRSACRVRPPRRSSGGADRGP